MMMEEIIEEVDQGIEMIIEKKKEDHDQEIEEEVDHDQEIGGIEEVDQEIDDDKVSSLF